MLQDGSIGVARRDNNVQDWVGLRSGFGMCSGRFSTVCMLLTGEPVSLGAFAFLEILHHWALSKGHVMD